VLTDGIISGREANRFLEVVQDAPRLPAGELGLINVALPAGRLAESKPGVF
jgi:2-methylcitrate dehydratase